VFHTEKEWTAFQQFIKWWHAGHPLTQQTCNATVSY
jgi:hypothetical protein